MEFSLDLKYAREKGPIYISGIQACVRLPLDQLRADRRRGLKTAAFISGYPGSPLGGLDLELQRHRRRLEQHSVFHSPGLNEELAATAVLGSQLVNSFSGAKYDGVLGMWHGKSPGVDRAGDAFKHANHAGVGKNGGVLVLGGDDPSAKSSSLPNRSEIAFYDAMMPTIYPGNVQEILDFGLHGFTLSRVSGLWVAMKIVADAADAAGSAEVSPDRIVPVVPIVELDGRHYEHRVELPALPHSLEHERTLHYARLELARRYAWENRLNAIVVPTRGAWIGILAAGKTYFDLREALRDLGLDDGALRKCGVRILKITMIFPMEPRIVREFARGLQEIIVIEEKGPFLEMFVRDILYASTERPVVVGKFDEEGRPLLPANGELDSDSIARAIAQRLGRKMRIESVEARIRYLDGLKRRSAKPSLARVPYFCSGCPHNRSIVVPDGSAVGAGIGCHSMAVFMEADVVGDLVGFTHMGCEGAQWVGFAPFTEIPHIFQNVGDGTFSHSASLALRYAVAAGANITYKILYNQAVAMTGGQDVPGALPIPNLTRLLEAEGVKRIIVTTDDVSKYKRNPLANIAQVWHRDRLLEAQTVLAAVPGVTVLVHDQQCAAETRRLRRRGKLEEPATSVYVNQRICEGCGDCGKKSGCLSVQPLDTEFGRKVQIHQSSCNKDYSCLLGDCPSFVTVTARETGGSQDGHPGMDVHLPEPVLKVPADEFSMYTMGIGGTGVVTANQILGMAAFLDGKRVLALDQTGLSQKAGPVTAHLKMYHQDMEGSNHVSTGGADLYLAFDLLVATQPNNLVKADSRRTIVVASTSEIPTGSIIMDTSLRFPDSADLLSSVDRVSRGGENFFLDAVAIAQTLFGDHMAANIVLLGAAYQVGAIPISAAAIEQAIRLNAVAMEMNLSAFRWGRVAVANPGEVDGAMMRARGSTKRRRLLSGEAERLVDSSEAKGELRHLLEIRVPDLIAYQNVAYAQRYVEFVRKVRDLEAEKTPGQTEIAEAVARYFYKVMAYKDTYEVARLHLDPEFRAELKATFGGTSGLAWYLRPPFLQAFGWKRKIRVGSRFLPVFWLLRIMKRLRGTALDIFGHTKVRRAERALIEEYQRLVESALAKLTYHNHGIVVAIASLPEEIRGYEQIKLDSIDRYRRKIQQLVDKLGTE